MLDAPLLEAGDEGSFALAFENGDIYVDGEVVGSYEPGDELDASLRGLLGQAMTLENGALAEALSPPIATFAPEESP